MYNLHFFSVLLILSTLLISCSATQQTAETEAPSETDPQASSIYPSWYSSLSEFVSTDSMFTAYGVAVSADSSEAVENAVEQAQANLEKYLSSRIESARASSLEKLGENSGLGSRSFIFALRKAEAAISESADLVRGEANPKENFESYNGFAAVAITKEMLVNTLSEELASNKNAWEALRTSQAFEKL